MSSEEGDTPASISSMFLNPEVLSRRRARFQDEPGTSRATVHIDDTSEDADRWIRKERRHERGEPSGDSEEGSSADGDAEEYEDGPGQPQASVSTGEGGQSVLNPVMSLAEQQSQEKTELLIRLHRYLNSGIQEITVTIPQRNYNLATPLSDLREVVGLCDKLMIERAKAKSRQAGRKLVYSGITFLANLMETMNQRMLEPESQFAIDKFGEFTEKEVALGTYEECADGMWEKLAPYMGGLTNPFVQFGIAFGFGMFKYVQERENAYRLGALPDPRPGRRKHLEEQEREEQVAYENSQFDNANDDGQQQRPFMPPNTLLPPPTSSANVPLFPVSQQQTPQQQSKIGMAATTLATAPGQANTFSFPAGFADSSDDEGSGPTQLTNNMGGAPMVFNL